MKQVYLCIHNHWYGEDGEKNYTPTVKAVAACYDSAKNWLLSQAESEWEIRIADGPVYLIEPVDYIE